MSIKSKKEYMETLRERYWRGNKREKGAILDEWLRNTGENRKYAIKKFRYKVKLKPQDHRKIRTRIYGKDVEETLIKVWEIFDRPCGQRLVSSLEQEFLRLMSFGEISCSDSVREKMLRISSASIDRHLRNKKKGCLSLRQAIERNPLLTHRIPVKVSAEFDREKIGYTQIDFVEHGGSSAAGTYINSLNVTDAASGWTELEAVMGKGQEAAFKGLLLIKDRLPFPLLGIHPDNQNSLLNYHMAEFCEEEKIEFTRSRPYRKNDNCFVEQKNYTHVRREVGYLRYESEDEQSLLNDLYRHELRLYKNYFEPVIKLKSKERVGGKIKKKYFKALTPYHYLLNDPGISAEIKAKMRLAYQSLNPAELKRAIDRKLDALYALYRKDHSEAPNFIKKHVPAVSTLKSRFGVIVK